MADEPKYSMPDGSYPINSCDDVTKAANLAHHSKKYSFAEVKAMILKASEGLSCPKSVLPATWDESGKNAAMPIGEVRAMSNFDPDGDGDDDSSPETDTDHDFWDTDGNPIMEAWLAAGASPPGSVPDADGDFVSAGTSTAIGYGPDMVGGSMTSAAPRDNLVRALPNHGSEWRESADSPMGQLYGIFSEFKSWYPVSSAYEGDFVERVMPGAFTDTIKQDRANMRVLFDHGQDPSLGNKPLGQISTLREEANGPYYEVSLYNTDYNREQIVPLLRGELLSGKTTGSALGSSFRFQVQDDQWNMKPKASKSNPNGLPQRSILKARVFEFGPVCFPANPGATAAARSMTDEWLARLIGDTRFQADFAERVGGRVAERILASIPTETQQEIIHQSKRGQQDKLRRQARALLAISG